MPIVCSECSLPVAYATRAKETEWKWISGFSIDWCRCVKQALDESSEYPIESLQKLLNLAEVGNTSAMGFLTNSAIYMAEIGYEIRDWREVAIQVGDLSAISMKMDEVYEDDWEAYLHCAERMISVDSPNGYIEKSDALRELGLDNDSKKSLLDGAMLGSVDCVEFIFEESRGSFGSRKSWEESDLKKIAFANLGLGKAEAAFYFARYKHEEREFQEAKTWFEYALGAAMTHSDGKPDETYRVSSAGLEPYEELHFAECLISKFDLYFEQAVNLFYLRDYAKAISFFELAFSFDSDRDLEGWVETKEYVQSLLFFGNHLLNNEKYDEAENYLVKASKFNPEALSSLGYLAAKRGLLSASKHWYELAANAGKLSGIKGMIWVCQQNNDLAGAEHWKRKLESFQNGSV